MTTTPSILIMFHKTEELFRFAERALQLASEGRHNHEGAQVSMGNSRAEPPVGDGPHTCGRPVGLDLRLHSGSTFALPAAVGGGFWGILRPETSASAGGPQ